MLQIAYLVIAEAQPLRLREIIAKAECLRVRARMFGDHALAKSALAIKERAERRLAWFKRQAQN
jgi:hypothetical protein